MCDSRSTLALFLEASKLFMSISESFNDSNYQKQEIIGNAYRLYTTGQIDRTAFDAIVSSLNTREPIKDIWTAQVEKGNLSLTELDSVRWLENFRNSLGER